MALIPLSDEELALKLIIQIKVKYNLKDMRDVPDFVDNLVNELEDLKWSMRRSNQEDY
jgi:hypothetical protein